MNKLNLPGPKAQALIERDKKVISSSYPRAVSLCHGSWQRCGSMGSGWEPLY